MPTFIQYTNCAIDGSLADAVLHVQELITERVLSAQDAAALVNTSLLTLDSTVRSPLNQELTNILAISPESAGAALCLPSPNTLSDIEHRLRDRDGLHIVNGRVLIPGDLDISCLRTMVRVLGTYRDAATHLSRLTSGSFVLVVTTVNRTISPATICSPETIVETETVIGIDTDINRLLSERGLTFETVKVYVFWSTFINTSRDSVARLEALHVPAAYIPTVLTGGTQDNVQSCVNFEVDRLLSLESLYGADVDRVVLEGPTALNPIPEASEVVSATAEAVSRRRPGSTTPCGTRDFSDPAMDLLTTINLDRTLDISRFIAECSSSPDPSVASIMALLNSFQQGVQIALDSIRSGQAFLSQNNYLLSLVQSLIGEQANNILACLTQGITSAGIAFLQPHIRSIQSILENGVNSFDTTIGQIQQFYGIFSSLLCTGSNLIQAACNFNRTTFPGLTCNNLNLSDFGITQPNCGVAVCDIMSSMLSLVNRATNLLMGNLQELRSLYTSLLQTLATRFNAELLALGRGATIGGTGAGVGSILGGLDSTLSSFSPASVLCNPQQVTAFFQNLVRRFGTTPSNSGTPTL